MTLHLTKAIPIAGSRLAQYQNAGWQLTQTGKTEHLLVKRMVTKGILMRFLDLKLVEPSLIQLGKIRRPLNKYQDLLLSDAVYLEAMEMPRIDPEALVTSIRIVESQFSLYQAYNVKNISLFRDGDQFSLHLFANFDSPEQYQQYVAWLTQLREGGLTPAPTRMSRRECVNELPDDTDFWWDTANSFFWSFDRNFIQRLPNNLRASISDLNQGE
jgi:hypothetical protein